MAKFMKSLAIIVLILMIIGSFVLGDALGGVVFQSSYSVRSQYNIVAALSGIVVSFIVFGMLYSVGYALSFLDDLRAFWKVPIASEAQAVGGAQDVIEKNSASDSASSTTPADPIEQKPKDASNPWA